MTRFNIPKPKEDVLSKAILKPSIRKKVDERYWKIQDKIKKEIFKDD